VRGRSGPPITSAAIYRKGNAAVRPPRWGGPPVRFQAQDRANSIERIIGPLCRSAAHHGMRKADSLSRYAYLQPQGGKGCRS